jgi:hypothetical protein
MLEKLKSWLIDDTVFYTVLLILIAIASFGLGRQSVAVSTTPVVQTESRVTEREVETVVPTSTSSPTTPNSSPEPLVPTPNLQSAAVIGSRSGTKYHLPTCPGAKQIKPENVITFATIAAAEAAGYTPAANCPGLTN